MNSMREHAAKAAAVLAQRYSDVTELGQGTHGFVYKARAGTKPVAIKVAFPFAVPEDIPGAVAFFRREGELASALHHPNILRTSPVEVVDGVEFFEMDFEGPMRLDHVVLQQHPPTFERVVAIMRELGSALDYAHAQGTLHGALRPTNVLLDGNGHVHLKGFVLRENEAAPHPALEPGAVGDAAYMAPEQWRLPRVDRRVDVYAAGVIAYELCTGQRRVSYDVPGLPEILPIELTPNRALREGIPLHVNAAIRRATAKEAPVRFASVGEFVEALANAGVALGHGLPTHLPEVKRQRTSPILLLLLIAAAAVAAALVPERSRDEVVKWGYSILAIKSPDIDPLDVSPSSSGGSSRGSSTGGGSSQPSSRTAPSPSRDTTQPAAASGRRPESERPEPGASEQRDGSSPRRAETPRGAAESSRDSPDATARGAAPTSTAGGANASQPEVDEGFIRVTADQGRAIVLIDGVPRGFAPVTFRTKPGTHRVGLRGTLTYDPREMRIDVKRADTAFAEFYATNAPLPDTTLQASLLAALLSPLSANGAVDLR